MADEISNQQTFDLLCEICDGMDRLDAKLDDNLALMRTINYEAELGAERVAPAKAAYHLSKEALSP